MRDQVRRVLRGLRTGRTRRAVPDAPAVSRIRRGKSRHSDMPAIVAFWLQRLPTPCWTQMIGLSGAGPACLDSCPRLPHARAGFGVRDNRRFYGLDAAQTHVAAKSTAAGEQRCTHPMPCPCDADAGETTAKLCPPTSRKGEALRPPIKKKKKKLDVLRSATCRRTRS